MNLFTKAGLSSAAVLAALVVGSQPAPAADLGHDHRHDEEVIRLAARTTQTRYIDVDDSDSPSQGDEVVLSGSLRQRGFRVGTHGEVCTLTRASRHHHMRNRRFDVQCVGTLALRRGQITMQGRVRVTGTRTGPIKFAVTGGTGRYRTARGYVRVVPVSHTRSRVTVHVIR